MTYSILIWLILILIYPLLYSLLSHAYALAGHAVMKNNAYATPTNWQQMADSALRVYTVRYHVIIIDIGVQARHLIKGLQNAYCRCV